MFPGNQDNNFDEMPWYQVSAASYVANFPVTSTCVFMSVVRRWDTAKNMLAWPFCGKGYYNIYTYLYALWYVYMRMMLNKYIIYISIYIYIYLCVYMYIRLKEKTHIFPNTTTRGVVFPDLRRLFFTATNIFSNPAQIATCIFFLSMGCQK